MMTFPNIDIEATGRNIQRLREKNGYSVHKLQLTLGLATAQAVYKWQQGNTLPSIDNLVALAWLFHVRIEDIIVCSTPTIAPVPIRSAA